MFLQPVRIGGIFHVLIQDSLACSLHIEDLAPFLLGAFRPGPEVGIPCLAAVRGICDLIPPFGIFALVGRICSLHDSSDIAVCIQAAFINDRCADNDRIAIFIFSILYPVTIGIHRISFCVNLHFHHMGTHIGLGIFVPVLGYGGGGHCILQGSRELATKGDILLLDVTPLSLSIETVGGVATRLVERNSRLPIHHSQIFSTTAPFQRAVEIHVLQGERPMAKDNKTIGRFKLTGIERAMAGVPQIEVTFDIDANGILKVSAQDKKTGKAQSITITAGGKMSEDEIQQAIRDAEMYAGQDSLYKDSMSVMNDARTLIAKVELAMKEKGKQVEKAEKRQIKADIAALNKVLFKCKPEKMNENDISELRSATAHLEASASHLVNL